MIVDVHTRIWESADLLGSGAEVVRRRCQPWERPDASPTAHQDAMETVQAAFIHGYESKHLEASLPIERVAAYVATAPERFYGFAGIDPAVGRPVKRLEEALASGLVGVTVSPSGQAFHPSDSRAMALYEACEAQGVPVFFDTAHILCHDAKLEFGQPYLLDEVARSFPNLRMVITGLGYPFIEQGLAMIGKHPHVYADLSDLILHPWRVYNALLLAYQHGVIDRILFGSNFPFCTPERAIVTIYSINTFPQGTHLPSVPREQLRSIVERDAFGALGLEAPVLPPARAAAPPMPPAPAPLKPAMAEERAT